MCELTCPAYTRDKLYVINATCNAVVAWLCNAFLCAMCGSRVCIHRRVVCVRVHNLIFQDMARLSLIYLVIAQCMLGAPCAVFWDCRLSTLHFMQCSF